jgi:hypothetical protein
MHWMQLNVSEGIISGGWNMPGKAAKITGGSFDPIYKKLKKPINFNLVSVLFPLPLPPEIPDPECSGRNGT